MEEKNALRAKLAEIAELKRSITHQKSIIAMNQSPYPAGYDSSEGPILRGGFQGRARVSRGRSLGRGRGSLRGRPQHRNMTLVLNPTNTTVETTKADAHSINYGDSSLESQPQPDKVQEEQETYVSTTSRNGLKLVNKKIYEDDQTKRIENSINLKKKLDQISADRRLQRSKRKIHNNNTEHDNCDRVLVEGDLYAVSKFGYRLVPLNMLNGVKKKRIMWNGKEYKRQPSGTLKAKFPTNFSKIEYCRYFTRAGICQKGSTCKYKHDPSHLAICKAYIKGGCHNGNCTLSHDPNQYNTPWCRFNLSGNCSNPNCNYEHVKSSENKAICRPFSIGGWCDRGKLCHLKHLHECPDYEESGSCPRGKSCKLAHPITKGKISQGFNNSSSITEDPNLLFVQGVPDPTPSEYFIDLGDDSFSEGESENEEQVNNTTEIHQDRVKQDNSGNESEIDSGDCDSDESLSGTESDEIEENSDYIRF